jgi:sulfur carrier protein
LNKNERYGLELEVNGETKRFESVGSVGDLLEASGIEQQSGIAIAVNREVVPQSQWKSRSLSDGDSVEIIRATQGG